jgi:hypothetical protein
MRLTYNASHGGEEIPELVKKKSMLTVYSNKKDIYLLYI